MKTATTLNFDKMQYWTVERIKLINNFEEKLGQLIKDNWVVKNIIRDKWKWFFQDIWDRLQNLVIDEILKKDIT